jgi:hypothetical protein
VGVLLPIRVNLRAFLNELFCFLLQADLERPFFGNLHRTKCGPHMEHQPSQSSVAVLRLDKKLRRDSKLREKKAWIHL